MCLVFSFVGCGSGIVLVTSLPSGGSSGPGAGNAAPVASDLLITGTRVSPAVVEFKLFDNESDRVDIELLFIPPGLSDTIAMALVDDTNLMDLSTSTGGVSYTKLWDFASQVGESFEDLYVYLVMPQ